MRKKTIEDMHALAAKRGGRCLSSDYIDNQSKLEWQCKKGHKWFARASNIKRHWCPGCSKNKKKTIEDMQEMAVKKGGKCLSIKYLNAHIKLDWQCGVFHTWAASPNSIFRGAWCPFCAIESRKKTIEDMQEMAAKRGGKCLSSEYIDSQSKLDWQCEKGHEWGTTPACIQTGSWCPYCGWKSLSIESMQEIASKHRGKCLSNEYINNGIGLEWECEKGHTWKAAPASVQAGSWCPDCKRGRSERRCREIFEKLFDSLFPSIYPDFLVNFYTGHKLQLDGYNRNLSLAFEYQGIQHYEYVEYWHKTREEFKKLQERDDIKRLLCKRNGVTLIEIPYTVAYDDLEYYITGVCRQLKLLRLEYKQMDFYF